MEPSGRQPDYDVVVLDKTTNAKGKVGGAWKNEDGSISVVLNPCVVLPASKTLYIRLFERREYQPLAKRASGHDYSESDS